MLLGVDNTVAISWMDSGTAKRPRAMRALRVLAAPGIVPRACLDALHPIRTQHPGGRCIAPRCFSVFPCESRVGVVSLFLRQPVRARDPRPLVPRYRSLRPCWRRSRPSGRVPYRGTRFSRITLGGPSGTSSRNDFGARPKIYRPRTSSTTSRTSQLLPRRAIPWPIPRSRAMWTSWGGRSPLPLPRPTNPVQHPEVKLFLRGVARTLGKQVEKAEPCTLQHLRKVSECAPRNLINAEAEAMALIALVAFWGCLRLGALIPRDRRTGTSADAQRPRGARHVPPCHGPSLKTIQFAERLHRIEVPAQSDSALVPLESIQPVDLAFATPVLPDHIVRAVHDRSYTAVAFAVPRIVQPHRPTDRAVAHGPFLSARLRSPCVLRGIPIWQVMHHGDWKSLEVAMSYAEDALIPNPLGGLSTSLRDGG